MIRRARTAAGFQRSGFRDGGESRAGGVAAVAAGLGGTVGAGGVAAGFRGAMGAGGVAAGSAGFAGTVGAGVAG